LPGVQSAHRPDGQKQGRGAGKSNKLHGLVSVEVAMKQARRPPVRWLPQRPPISWSPPERIPAPVGRALRHGP
jgi:hypothetical protein